MEYTEAEKVVKYYNQIDNDIKLQIRLIHDIDERYGTEPPKNIIHMKQTHQRKIEDLCACRAAILDEIDTLSTVEKVIIMKHYCDDQDWNWVAAQVCYSASQCKNIRRRAINKLQLQFENNEAIRKIFPELTDK